MSKKDRKARLWHAGHTLCPICLTSLSSGAHGALDTKLATLDHVPAKALFNGPYRPVLTCRSCNNRAGGTFELAASDALKGEMPAEIEFAGKAVSVRTRAVPKTRPVETERQQQSTENTPSTAQRRVLHMELSHPAAPFNVRIEASGGNLPPMTEQSSLRINYKTYIHPEVAWLKSAYLLLYSILGPRYAQGSGLEPVRRKIQNPATSKSIVQILETQGQTAESEPAVAIVYLKPKTCWGVFIGRMLVLLPNASDAHWHERENKDSNTGVRHRIVARLKEMPYGFLEPVVIPVENTDSGIRQGIQEVGPLGWEITRTIEGKVADRFISIGEERWGLLAVPIVARARSSDRRRAAPL